MKKIIVLSILLVFAISMLVWAISVKPTTAAPCQPCAKTWGAIKACYSGNPPACCACGKDEARPNQTFDE